MGLLALFGIAGVLGVLSMKDNQKRAYSDRVNADPYKDLKEGGNDVCAIAVKRRMREMAKQADDIFKEEYQKFKEANPDVRCFYDLTNAQFVSIAIACEEHLAKSLRGEYGARDDWHYPSVISKKYDPPAWIRVLIYCGRSAQVNHGYRPYDGGYEMDLYSMLPNECFDGELCYSIFPQIYKFTGYGGNPFLSGSGVHDGNSLYWYDKNNAYKYAQEDKYEATIYKNKPKYYRMCMENVIRYKYNYGLFDNDLATLTEKELIELIRAMGDNYNEMEIFL